MDTNEVIKIYSLANLSLEGKDTQTLANKFNIVLDFIEEIFDVDTDGVELTESITEHYASFRDDNKVSSISRDEALLNAPDKEFGYFRIDWNL